MLRSILAVILGYVAMIAATLVTSGVLAVVLVGGVPNAESRGTPPTSYIVANLIAGAACAVAGGWVAARLAPARPRLHAAVLAALTLGLGVQFAVSQRGGPHPGWYLVLLPVVGALGVMLGGALRRAPRRAAAAG